MRLFHRALWMLNFFFNATAFAQEPQPLSEIDNAVEHFVYQSLREHHGEHGDYVINIGHLDPRLKLEKCQEPLVTGIEYGQLSQNAFTVKLTCLAPKQWTVRLPVKVQVFKQVVVSTEHISKDQPLAENQLQVARQDVSQIGDAYYQSIDDLIHLVAQRNIAPGSILRYHMVKQPVLVHRGQIIKMLIEAPGVKIESSGVAQNDGIKGQLIKVKNIRSNKIVDAMVVDSGITVIPI